jgi:hypothetical protein
MDARGRAVGDSEDARSQRGGHDLGDERRPDSACRQHAGQSPNERALGNKAVLHGAADTGLASLGTRRDAVLGRHEREQRPRSSLIRDHEQTCHVSPECHETRKAETEIVGCEVFGTDDAGIGVASFLEPGPGHAEFTGR